MLPSRRFEQQCELNLSSDHICLKHEILLQRFADWGHHLITDWNLEAGFGCLSLTLQVETSQPKWRRRQSLTLTHLLFLRHRHRFYKLLTEDSVLTHGHIVFFSTWSIIITNNKLLLSDHSFMFFPFDPRGNWCSLPAQFLQLLFHLLIDWYNFLPLR